MTVEFRFVNGTSQVYLTPTTEREKSMIRLFREGVTGSEQLKLTASSKDSPETLVIQVESKESGMGAGIGH